MLRTSLSLAGALGVFATACGLDTSGLVFGWTPSTSPNGPGDADGVNPGVADAGALALSVDALGRDEPHDATGPDGAIDIGSEVGPAPFAGGPASASSLDAATSQDDGATGLDGPDAAVALFACGIQLRCSLLDQVCCLSSSNQNGSGSNAPACATGSTCSDPTATLLRCTAAADCAAIEVCCLSQQSSPATSQCSPQCKNGDVQLCDPSAPSTSCGGNATCTVPQGRGTNLLPVGVGTCG